MEISFYTNHSELNKLDKDLTTVTTLSGTLKEGCSVTDPVILVEMDTPPTSEINYAYIPDFGRYYFVRAIDYAVGKQWRIAMHVDVLSTYAEQIRLCPAVISRQQFDYNMYLNDSQIPLANQTFVITNQVGDSFQTAANRMILVMSNSKRGVD